MATGLPFWSLILILLPSILSATEYSAIPSAPPPLESPTPLIADAGPKEEPTSLKAPHITSIIPDEIGSCRLQQDGIISVQGYFPPGTLLFLDGSVVDGEYEEDEIEFEAPSLPEGRHQVQAVDPSGRTSLPLAFTVNNIPQIASVQKGDDKVTSYEIILTGRNFLFDSILVVNDRRINAAVPQDGAAPYTLPEPPPGSDRVRYIDCSTLIYIRHPFSGETKNLRFRIVNPGGIQSNLFEADLP